MAADNIKVAIKVRPLLKKESKLTNHWKIVENSIQLIESQSDPFYFDHIFDENATNEKIFDTMSKPIVDAALRGFNGTIFAYGQTSSGKTYTMLGDEKNPGVMILAVREIFKEIEKATDREFLIRVGYIEIYNEKINDLLDKKNQDLKIHETTTGEVAVNCTDFIIRCEEDMLNYLHNGNKARRIGETIMNERSSRSHAIFRIIIESREFDKPTDETAVQISHLNLVDLAGSERADQTGATGSRLKEGCHINKSLLSLSLVIKKLSENESDKYINYRDSKLTRILQASLGGNALTAIICTIKSTTIEETNSTLSFAMRAKTIKNKPQKNEIVSDAAMMKRLAKEISRLQNELEVEKSKNSKLKISQIERKIKDAELKIVHSHALTNNTNQTRRRTWCPSSSQPEAISNGTSNENGCDDMINDFPKPAPMFITPLITMRNYRQENVATEEKFVSADEIKFDLIDERSLNDLNTPRKNTKFVGKKSLTPINDIRAKYKMLETEFNELQGFISLEKEAELCEAKSKIANLQIEHQELIGSSYEQKVKLDRTQERCLELESRISELNEKIDSLVCQQNGYQIEIEERQQTIKSLLMASKDTESLTFEYEKHKEKSKSREEDLVTRLKEREARIESLEKQLRETVQSHNSENRSLVIGTVKCSNANYDESVLANQSYNSADSEIDTVVVEQSDMSDTAPTDIAILNNSNNSIVSNGIEPTSSDIKNKCSDDLQKQLDSLKKSLTEKEQQLKESHLEIEKMKSQNRQMEESHNELSDQMMEHVYENENLNKKCRDYEIDLRNTQKVNDDLKLKIDRIENMSQNASNEHLKSTTLASEVEVQIADLHEFASSIVEEIIDNLPVNSDDDKFEETSPNNLQGYQSELNQLATNKKTFLINTNSIEKLNSELSGQISEYECLNKELSQRLDILNSKLGKSEVKSVELVETQKELNPMDKLDSTNSRDKKETGFHLSPTLEIAILKDQLSFLEKRKKNIETNYNALLKSHEDHMIELEETKHQLSELLIHKSNWEGIISQSEEDIAKFKEQVGELQKELMKARCEKEATDEMLVRLQETRSKSEVKIDSKIQEISSLQQKNAELCKSLTEFDDVKNEMKAHKNQIHLIQQQLNDKKLKIVEIEGKNVMLHENQKVLIEDKEKLGNHVAELEAQVMRLKDEQGKLEEVLKIANDENVEKEKEKIILKQKIENLSQSESNLQSSLTQYKETLLDLENDKTEMKTIQMKLETQIKEYEEVNSLLSVELAAIKEEKIELDEKLKDVQGAMVNVEHMNDKLKLSDDKRSSEIIDLMDMKAKLESQVEELVSNKEEFSKNYEAIRNENAELKAALGNTQMVIKSLEAERNSLQQSIKNANGNLIELREERDSLLEFKKELENQFQSKLREECEVTLAEMTIVRSQNLVLADKMEILVSEKDELQVLLNSSVLRNEVLQKDISTLGEKLEKMRACSGEWQTKCTQAESQNVQLNARLSDYESHIAGMENEIKRLCGEIETSKTKHQEQFEKANSKLNKLKEELEIQIQQFNRIKTENEEMKQELVSKQNTPTSTNDSAVKEKEELLRQLHEMQKMHIYKIKQYQQEIQTLRAQITEKGQKKEASNSCNKTSTDDGDKQKIKALIGENDELRLTNETLTAELAESRKLSQKDRKTKRYSNHDESRSLLWCDRREACTMTDPTDKLCNCEQLDKDLMESKKNLLIKDCQINTLRMELKHNPLRDECDRLKRMIEEEEREKREMRRELHKLRLKISELYNTTKECDQCVRKSNTVFLNQSSQTLFTEDATKCPEQSKWENDYTKLLDKYEELKRLCRLRNSKISHLEDELSKKDYEAANRLVCGAANHEHRTSDSVVNELTLFKKKYREAKFVIGFRDQRIHELETELSQTKTSQ